MPLKLLVCLISFGLLMSCRERTQLADNTDMKTERRGNLALIPNSAEKDQMSIDYQLRDSICFERALVITFDSLQSFLNADHFENEYEIDPGDSLPVVQSIVTISRSINPRLRHLFIRLSQFSEHRIFVLRLEGNRWVELVRFSNSYMELVSDSIYDVNADGLNDYIVNWYGTNGCCLKAFSDVFLSSAAGRQFSKNFHFINPSFYPNEAMVRGIHYGHPGQTELYKYKWRGTALDTLEYLYFENDSSGKSTEQLIRSETRDRVPMRTDEFLSVLPLEYHSVNNIDWFLGAFHDGPYNANNNHFKSWQSFVPEGFNVLDKAEGDLNMDGKEDLVLLLKNDLENIVTDTTRPILLLAGNGRKGYRLLERAERVAMCLGCGGVYGDPHERLVVGKGYFYVEHRGGSGWRWTRTNRFKYDKKRKRFILDNDRVVSWHVSEPEKTEERWHHPENFGTQTLRDYNYDLFK